MLKSQPKVTYGFSQFLYNEWRTNRMDIKFYAIAVLLLSSVMSGAFAAYSIINFRTSGAKSYSCLMGCISVYSLGYAFELYSTSLSGMLIASKIQYLGISFIPVLWLSVAASYAGYWKRIPKNLSILLFVIPVMTLLFRFSNEFHLLVYKGVAVDNSGPFPVLEITRGIWYYINTVYSYICLVAGNICFLKMAVKSSGPYRKQAVTLVCISILPWVADIIYQNGMSPLGLDLAPFAFAIVGPVLAWGIFYLRIFDFVPITRETIFDFMGDPVIVFDTSDRLVDFNKSADSVFDTLSRRAIGTKADFLFSRYPELFSRICGDQPCRDIKIQSKEVEHIYEYSTMPVVAKVRRDVGRIIMLHDVTEQRKLMDQLQDMATKDGLTGIFNHRYLMELSEKELSRSIRHGRPLTLILADIDFFKQVNDTYGHLAGDEVLRTVAKVFQRNIRSTDILGRYGGEEFGLLLPETCPEDGKALAERIRHDLENVSVKSGETEISITASFGAAGYSFNEETNDTLVTLFKRVDVMLYKAKERGRNLVVLAEDNNCCE